MRDHVDDRAAVRRLDQQGILNERTLAAHCVHISAADRALLARRGVNVIHNPQSNANNGVGIANVPALLRRGVLVGLGTDGYTPRLWDEFKAASQLQKSSDPPAACPELLFNNREVVKKIWGADLGRIETGACADLLLLDYAPPTPIRTENLAGHLLFGIANAPVNSLIVNGRYVVRDGRCVTLDERAIAAKAAARAQLLWERI